MRFSIAGLLSCVLVAQAADLRVDSNLVLIPVAVTDATNGPILGLPASRFRIFEGNSEQAILHVSMEDQPASIGIVFDASGSMEGLLPVARRAVAAFLKNLTPEDEVFLVNCSDRASLAVPFTNNAGEIQNRLLFAASKGKTPLLDAIHLAVATMKEASHTRKALFIVSDGADNDSRFTQTEILRIARETGIWIYSAGVQPAGLPMMAEEAGGGQLLAGLAAATGARHIAVHSANDLTGAAARIALEIRNQYVLAYRPRTFVADGKFRKVQVKLTDAGGMLLSHRPGYVAR